jgi:hypothetical protein
MKKKGKIWRNTLWKDPGVKVQEPNIEGLTSFGRKRLWKGKKGNKREGK